jgi:hypothetical protein
MGVTWLWSPVERDGCKLPEALSGKL